jgi:ERCC4-type nuclease
MSGMKDWTVESDKLAVGDYIVGNVLGVERKSPSDFLGSFSSGRLQQQCHELAEAFATPVLLIEGSIEDVLFDKYRNFNPNAVTAMIASLTVKTRVIPLFCGGKGTIHMVKWLALKAVDDSVVSYTPIRPKASQDDLQLFFLASLPGVGNEKARALLEFYGTPLRALNAWDKWEEVEGFGKKTIERVGNVIAVRGQISAENAK